MQLRTNRFYPFRGNGLLLRLPHLHGHQESAGGPERGKGEPYGRRDRHIGRGKELRPTRVSRDEEKKEEAVNHGNPNQTLDKGKDFRRPGYREAIMTDGILVDDLIHEIDRLAETGTSDLRPCHIHLRERKVSKYTFL